MPSSFSSSHPADLDLAFFVAKLGLVTRNAISFPPYGAANLIRGQFGKSLFAGRLYEKLFAPPHRTDGPSGLKDPPRPYVLRTASLDGKSFPSGAALDFTVHVFDEALVPDFAIASLEHKRLSLALPVQAATCVRVDFLTPTELKNAPLPSFDMLFARLRDRISALRAIYGAGPLAIDFKPMGERAQAILMREHHLEDIDRTRTSKNTGQHHPIGGFVGHAIYEGALTEFLPYLEAGYWTGVGRQTVWGKGQIRTTILD